MIFSYLLRLEIQVEYISCYGYNFTDQYEIYSDNSGVCFMTKKNVMM